MKKIFVLILISLLLVGCSGKIKLEDKYYGKSKYIDLDYSKVDDLIESKENFVIFIYQPMCTMSSSFEEILDEYMKKSKISVYKMSFTDMKKTSLKDTVKFYPSFIIFKDGEVVDFLDADSDEDTKKYKELDAFKEWFESYVEV